MTTINIIVSQSKGNMGRRAGSVTGLDKPPIIVEEGSPEEPNPLGGHCAILPETLSYSPRSNMSDGETTGASRK